MRAEAVPFDASSANHAARGSDEDKWHVALAPGEVKVVSLEQLDDLFRLSIVDAETKVWQDGMSEWQPLRVIAGIEDEAPLSEPERTLTKPRSAPPPPPQRASTRPAPPSGPPAMSRPAMSRPAPPPAPAAAPSRRPPPPAPRAPSLPPPALYAAPIALPWSQPALAAPPSFAPALSVRPLVAPAQPRANRSGGGFGRVLIALCVLGGVSVTAYRNGLAREAAHALHQEAPYARLEAALGGPSLDTVRGVEALVSRFRPSSASSGNAVSETDPQPTGISAAHTDPSPALPARGETAHGAPVVSLESLLPENAAPVKTAAVTTPVSAPASKSSAVTKAIAASPKPAIREKPAPAPKPKPAPKSESTLSARERLDAAIGRSVTTSPAQSSKGTKSKGNSDYDPLNPKL